MIRSNYLIHDCETGGLDCTQNPITQYAAIVLDGNTLKEVDRFETYVKPYNDLTIEQVSLDKTGLSLRNINNGISSADFVKSASEFYGEHQGKSKKKETGRLISVGHNIPFDHNFLQYIFTLHKKDLWYFVYEHFMDTMLMSKMQWGLTGEEKLQLGQCCVRANVQLTDAHTAMNDVEATADLFRYFTKKLRSKRGESLNEEKAGRAKGSEFFEFQCAK